MTKFAWSTAIFLGALSAIHAVEGKKTAQVLPVMPSRSAAWPKFGHDAQNSGRGGGQGARGVLRWRVWSDSSQSKPIVGLNGVVYVGTSHQTVLALDGQTGQPLPSFQAPNNAAEVARHKDYLISTDYYSPAQGADGTLYIGAGDDCIYALDGQTGRRKWQFLVGEPCYSSPTFSPDERLIYVGCTDWEVYALDQQTGKKVWGFRTGDRVEATPAVGPDGTVYASSIDGSVYALDGKTGKQRWRFDSTDVFYAAPCLAPDGMLYVANKAGRVYGLNSRTGKQVWTFKMKESTFCTPALGPDGTIYDGADSLYALDAHTGKPKWTYPIKGSVNLSSLAVAANGTVYIGGGDHNLYAVDGRSGKLRWTFKTGGAVDSSPAIGADGTVYFGSDDGYLYAVR